MSGTLQRLFVQRRPTTYRVMLVTTAGKPSLTEKQTERNLLYFLFQLKYKEEAKKEFNNYSIVTDTPVYVTAVLGHTWASEVSELDFKEYTFDAKCTVTALI